MNATISVRQAKFWITMHYMGSAILFLPGLLASAANKDAWLSCLLAVGAHCALIPLFLALGKQIGNNTVVSHLVAVFGKWPGKAVSFVFTMLYPYLIYVLTLRDISDFTTSTVYPQTPGEAFMAIMGSVAIYGVYKGVRAIGRAAELVFPVILLSIVVLVFSFLPTLHGTYVLPVMEFGAKPIVKASIPLFAFPYLELPVLLYLRSYLEDKKSFGKTLYFSGLLSGTIFFITTLFTLMTIGGNMTAHLNYSSFYVTRTISIGDFYERIEAIVTVSWYVLIYFRLCLLFLISSHSFAEIFSLDRRRLLVPLLLVSIPLATQAWPSSVSLMSFEIDWPYYAAIFSLLFPLVLLLAGKIKNRPA